MELKNINEIKDGMVVFMPSGIQATLFLDGNDILVEYPEMYKDRYTKEQFQNVLEKGIFAFDDHIKNPVMESLIEKGFIRKDLVENNRQEYSIISTEECETNFNEAYEQEKQPEGSVFKAQKEKPLEYLTPDFKNELLTALTKIAKEYPNVKVRQQATTFMDEIGLQEYYDTKAVNEFIKKYTPILMPKHEAFEDTDKIIEIADALSSGEKSGDSWICNTSWDEKWEALTEDAQSYILRQIHEAFYFDGYDTYTDLPLIIDETCQLNKQDLESMDVFNPEQIDNILNDGEETAYISYTINIYNNEAFKLKQKKKKKKLDELSEDIYLKGDDGSEEGPFQDQDAKEEFIKTQRQNGNDTEYEEVIKEDEMNEAMHVLDQNVKNWYVDKYPTDTLGQDINEEITFNDVVDGIENGKDIYNILGVNDSIVRERIFDFISRYGKVDVYNKWLLVRESLNEDAYKVYNSLDVEAQPATFDSWDEVDDYLNRTWGDYKANMAKENADYGTDEDKEAFFGNFDIELVPIEIEEPVCADCNEEPCECEEPCEDITEDADEEIIEEPVENKEDVETEESDDEDKEDVISAEDAKEKIDDVEDAIEDIEDFIKSLLDFEDEAEEIDDVEPIEEMCMQKLPDLKQMKKDKKEKEEDKKKNEDVENKRYIVSIQLGKDDWDEQAFEHIDQAVQAFKQLKPDKYSELIDAKNDEVLLSNGQLQEEFQDGMSAMLTNINDLDFPDALHDTVDVKDDGSLYKLSDLAKEVEELKSSLKTEIESIKNDIKLALQDVKQDITQDVNNVENKVQDTKTAVDDLTVEEDELEEPTETEETEQVEEPAEEQEATEEEQVEESFKGNLIYDSMKKIITEANQPICIQTLATKLREDFGINTKNPSTYAVVTQIAEKTSLGKKLVSMEQEQQLFKESYLGVAANYLGTGLMGRLEKQKQEKLNEDLNDIKANIDRMAREGKDGQDIKNLIDLKADNDKEREEAENYALDKLEESKVDALKKSLLRTSRDAKLNNL